MLDWDDLQYVLAVARHGSLSAAARVLGVTQATMGRRIAAFEARLGAQLFARSTAGWALSDVGRAVVEHAEHMQEHAVIAESLASGRHAGIGGPVRITAAEWLIRSVLGPLLGPLLARHPGLCIELVGEARHVNLARREADIALRPSRFTHQDVFQHAVAVIEFGLYASDAYLARHGPPDFPRAATAACRWPRWRPPASASRFSPAISGMPRRSCAGSRRPPPGRSASSGWASTGPRG